MKKLFFLAILVLTVSCHENKLASGSPYPEIPAPVSYEVYPDAAGFSLSGRIRIVSDERLGESAAPFLAEGVAEHVNEKPELLSRHMYYGDPGSVLYCYDHTVGAEGFRLTVTRDFVQIEASDSCGAFYATQFLLHSLDLQSGRKKEWPAVQVYDGPHFHYRGAMLDVSRNFFTVPQVKRFIDMMAIHRLNHFHWHLTDDQGWRIEIKSYPELTETGAWRGKDAERTGGYYTQDEVREIVSYAAARCIEVIPEIDMPGHSSAALAAYPELGCTGGPYHVATEPGGVHKDVMCTARDEVYVFVEKVLSEVASLFPSEYIHIGGDEVPRDRWQSCGDCQRLIRKEGIRSSGKYSAEDILQYRFNGKVRKISSGLGKKIIGWDEILSDYTDRDVTIMSWRGLGGGLRALEQGHDVVLSPVGYSYFNNYQTMDISGEPISTNGIVTMMDAYSFPLPEETGEGTFIGVEACLWTSFIYDDRLLDYQMLPRLAAFSEVAWRGPYRSGFDDFLDRLPSSLALYEAYGYSYSPHFYSVEAGYSVSHDGKSLKVALSAPGDAEIRYTTDGSRPGKDACLYADTLIITDNTDLRAVAWTQKGLESETFSMDFSKVKSTFAETVLHTSPEQKYAGEGGSTLTDGVYSTPFCTTGLWLGFKDDPMDVTVDLGDVCRISTLSFSSLVDMSAYIMGVRRASVSVSEDGVEFTEVAEMEYEAPAEEEHKNIKKNVLELGGVDARYVRVLLEGFDALPEWHSGAGSRPFLFVDEIEID